MDRPDVDDLRSRLGAAIERLEASVASDPDALVDPRHEIDTNHLVGLVVAAMRGDATIERLANAGAGAPVAGRPAVLARDLLISATLAQRALGC